LKNLDRYVIKQVTIFQFTPVEKFFYNMHKNM